MNAQSLYWWHLETEIQFRGRQWAHESCLGVVQSIFDILKIYYTKPNDPMNSIHRSEVKRVKRTLRLRTNQWSWVLNKISRIGPLNNVCGMLPGPHWLRILPRFFFFFFFLFSFAFFALFFPLILRFSGSSSILLRNTKTSLWSRRCKRQKQHPSGSEWYNECVRCDLKVYKKKQEKSGLENWLSCRRNLPTPPPQLFISLRRR